MKQNYVKEETTKQRSDVSEFNTKWKNRGEEHCRQEF